jgi:hypothetical protein
LERGTQKLRTFDIRDLAADNMSGLCVKSLHADGLGEGKVRLVPHAKEQMLHGRRLARKRGCDHGVNNASFRADTLFNVEDDLRDGQHL